MPQQHRPTAAQQQPPRRVMTTSVSAAATTREHDHIPPARAHRHDRHVLHGAHPLPRRRAPAAGDTDQGDERRPSSVLGEHARLSEETSHLAALCATHWVHTYPWQRRSLNAKPGRSPRRPARASGSCRASARTSSSAGCALDLIHPQPRLDADGGREGRARSSRLRAFLERGRPARDRARREDPRRGHRRAQASSARSA